MISNNSLSFIHFIFFISLISLFSSCSTIPRDVKKALKLSGDNKAELQAVLDHYSGEEHNREKLEAAYYLIKNMPGHYSISGQEIFNPVFDEMALLIKSTGVTKENKKLFSHLIDSVMRYGNPAFEKQYDLNIVTSEYLIENIDLAFLAYSKVPDNLKYKKDTFYKFILPYRTMDEPLENGLRRYFFERYSWAYDRLTEYGSVDKFACDLLDSINIHYSNDCRYPFTMPILNNYKIGVSNSCNSMVNMVLFIFRSLGIAAAHDFTPSWGNSYNRGHGWFVLFTGDSTIAIDIPKREIMNRLYQNEALPKVYRQCFEINTTNNFSDHCIDVTNLYRSTSDINLPPNLNKSNTRLAVFNSENGWVTIDKTKRSLAPKFKNIGLGIVYGIIKSDKGGIYDVDDIFYLTNDGEMIKLKANIDDPLKAVITRKNPMFTLRLARRGNWIGSLNGCEFQGANHIDFSDAECLLKVEEHNSLHNITYNVKNKKKYKYYRLVNPEKSFMHLSGFSLLRNGEKVDTEWKIFYEEDARIHPEGHLVVDDDPLTLIRANLITVYYYFQEPVCINEFCLQSWTDDNDVSPGDAYEFMYWDNIWVSTGIIEANDTVLVYDNVPSGTLYWLKNHTKGKEEHVFLLDKEGNQYWPGVTSVNHMYRDFVSLERLCE